MSLNANYFDGRSSRRQPVRLSADEGCLLIESTESMDTRSIPVADIRVSETQGRAPRTLRFTTGFCEVEQGPALDALLATLGCRESAVVRMQSRWRWAFASDAIIVLCMVAGYLWGLPWAAEALAPRVPVSVMAPISDEAMVQLDKYLLKASNLPDARREKLQHAFRTLAATDPSLAVYGDNLSLEFRSSPKIGPNAFALPGGQIVLFDELAELYEDDDEILAVLCHELGHLSKRHGIRQIIQSSVVAAVTAAMFGDFSYTASMLSAAILDFSYSREMESEADAYAADLLRQHGKSPLLLASALEKMEAYYGQEKKESESEEKKEDGKQEDEKQEKEGIKFPDWLSSHPETAERIRRLRGN
jgi:Zn-dependent protease with chaperone function